MSVLFLTRRDEKCFKEQDVIEILLLMEGMSGLREDKTSFGKFEVDFEYNGENVEIYLDADLESIVISEINSAGIEFAWMFQQATSLILRVFDESYSFDLDLADFKSSDALRSVVDLALQED